MNQIPSLKQYKHGFSKCLVVIPILPLYGLLFPLGLDIDAYSLFSLGDRTV